MPGFKVNQPMGAFYVFPDVSALFGKSFNGKVLENANDVAFFLLEEVQVASVSGAAFGTQSASVCPTLRQTTCSRRLSVALTKPAGS